MTRRSWRPGKRDLVKPIVDINLGARKRYPRITIGFPQEHAAGVEALQPLIDRGFKVSTKQLYTRLRFTPPDKGEEVLHPVEKISDRENAGTPPADGVNRS